MCLALSQHHAALPEHHAALIPICLALSQYCMLSHVLCFVSASLTPFLLSLMCLSCLVTALALSCALLCLNITSLLRCLRVTRCSCSLMCLALSGSASRCSLKCFVSARRSCALPCLSMTLRRSKPVNRLRSGSAYLVSKPVRFKLACCVDRVGVQARATCSHGDWYDHGTTLR